MQALAQIVVALNKSVAKHLAQRGQSQIAEDVAQEMSCEVYRQPKTQEYLLNHAEQILHGGIPRRMKRKAHAKAHTLAIESAHATVIDQQALVDERSIRDAERLHAALDFQDLCKREPLIRRLTEAQRNGCRTRKQLAKYLNLGERTLYARLASVRRVYLSD